MPLASYKNKDNFYNKFNYSRILSRISTKSLSALAKDLRAPVRYLDDNNHLTSIYFNGKLLLKAKYFSKEISYTLGDEGCLYYCTFLVYNTNTYPPNKDVILSKYFHFFYRYNVHRQQAKDIRMFISNTITSAKIRLDECNIVLDFYLNYPDFKAVMHKHDLENAMEDTGSSFPLPYFTPEGGKTIKYPSSDKVLVKESDNIRHTRIKSFTDNKSRNLSRQSRHYHSEASSVSEVFKNPIPSTYISSKGLPLRVYFTIFQINLTDFIQKIQNGVPIDFTYTVFVKVRYNKDEFFMPGNQSGFNYTCDTDIENLFTLVSKRLGHYMDIYNLSSDAIVYI